MFCTQCKRLWSWKTGKFETRGHNPHYLQWMRENHAGGMPREPGDVLCGREIEPRFLVQLHATMANYQFNSLVQKSWNDAIAKDFGAIFMMLNSIPHLRFHEVNRFTVDRVAMNLSARKAFVANSMTLTRFKQTILRNHILAQKNENITQIMHAVIQATTDIAFRFHDFIIHYDIKNTAENRSTAHNFANELFNLKAYANHELALIHSDFKSTPSKIYFFDMFDFKFVNVLKPSHTPYADTRFPSFNHPHSLRR
jgi:hypothetical protein